MQLNGSSLRGAVVPALTEIVGDGEENRQSVGGYGHTECKSPIYRKYIEKDHKARAIGKKSAKGRRGVKTLGGWK